MNLLRPMTAREREANRIRIAWIMALDLGGRVLDGIRIAPGMRWSCPGPGEHGCSCGRVHVAVTTNHDHPAARVAYERGVIRAGGRSS